MLEQVHYKSLKAEVAFSMGFINCEVVSQRSERIRLDVLRLTCFF